MRRRSITALLCAAVAAAACALPAAALAQSTAAPAPSAAPASATAPASTTAPGVSTQTASSASNDSTAALILLAAVGALLLLVGVLWGIARWRAWEPHWLLRWRHATGEAAWRTSAAWAEFRDWIRLGR